MTVRIFLYASVLFLATLISSSLLAKDPLEETLSYAYEAAIPYKKEYSFRKDRWGGDLAVGEKIAITTQLFKGNQYWFIVGSDVKSSLISVHLYNEKGEISEDQSWQKPHDKKHFSAAGAHITPNQTGTYFAIIKIEKSPEERTHWGLVYGYKDTPTSKHAVR